MHNLFKNMLKFAEGLNGPIALKFCKWLAQIGLSIDEIVKVSLKYTLVMQGKGQFMINPLAIESCRFRVLLASAYCLFGELRVKHKASDID